MHFLCSEIKSTHLYARIAQILLVPLRLIIWGWTNLACKFFHVSNGVLIFTIHSFPLVFFPWAKSRQINRLVSFKKRKIAYWLVNNGHKTQETLEQQLKRTHISKQPHTNTRKAASPHMHDLLIRASHGPRELIAVCRICHYQFPSVLDPIAHRVYRNPNPNTNQRRRYHTSQNESVPTSKSQRSQIWDSHSFTA